MVVIQQKDYNWKKFNVYGELAAGIIFLLWSYLSSLKSNSVSVFLFFLFLIFAIYCFWHFYHMKTNKTYIKVTQEGMNIYPRYFIGSTKFVEWSSISKIKVDSKIKMVLSQSTGMDISLSLGLLSKDDRESLASLVKEVIHEKSNSGNILSSAAEQSNIANDDILPEAFKCPNCSEDLELDRTERENKKFTCPGCKKLIDLS